MTSVWFPHTPIFQGQISHACIIYITQMTIFQKKITQKIIFQPKALQSMSLKATQFCLPSPLNVLPGRLHLAPLTYWKVARIFQGRVFSIHRAKLAWKR